MTRPNTTTAAPQAALHRLFWRMHFWAGLITAPIVVFAALTGLLYVFSPQIEAWRHANVDQVAVPAHAATRSLDDQVQAAIMAVSPHHPSHPHVGHEGMTPRHVVPALRPGETTQVVFRHAGGEHNHAMPQGQTVYVNPYTAEVVGTLADMDRFKTWSKNLHSSALQGDGWRWLLELATSWMLVMLATGLYLWWPRSAQEGGPGWRALLPRWGRGRLTWRDLHASVAIVMSLVFSVVLLTGLTWSKYTGAQFKSMQKALHQEAARVPKDLRSQVPPQGPDQALSWQQVHERVLALRPEVSVTITPPADATAIWRIENFDRSQPTRRFVLALDRYSGQTLFASGWDQMPLLPRATAVGIPFHRGEFGWWNQALLVLVALSALFSVISGLVMWWQRRPQGAMGAPRLARSQVRAVPWWFWLVMAALGYAMPVFGISLLACLAIEAMRLWRTPLSDPASSA